jgi:hypothetical protein
VAWALRQLMHRPGVSEEVHEHGLVAMFVAPLAGLLLRVAPLLLLLFGTTCVGGDRHCGSGGRRGGIAMVALGALGAALPLAQLLLASGPTRSQRAARERGGTFSGERDGISVTALLRGWYFYEVNAAHEDDADEDAVASSNALLRGLLHGGAALLGALGGACVDATRGGGAFGGGWQPAQRGEVCGGGGEGAGVAMLVTGLLALVALVRIDAVLMGDGDGAALPTNHYGGGNLLAARDLFRRTLRPLRTLVVCAACAAPPLLVTFGAMCRANGTLCGAHDGYKAGGAMLGVGIALSLAVLWHTGNHFSKLDLATGDLVFVAMLFASGEVSRQARGGGGSVPLPPLSPFPALPRCACVLRSPLTHLR